jgi:hypothetical protein
MQNSVLDVKKEVFLRADYLTNHQEGLFKDNVSKYQLSDSDNYV